MTLIEKSHMEESYRGGHLDDDDADDDADDERRISYHLLRVFKEEPYTRCRLHTLRRYTELTGELLRS